MFSTIGGSPLVIPSTDVRRHSPMNLLQPIGGSKRLRRAGAPVGGKRLQRPSWLAEGSVFRRPVVI
jgi:hypothetical protein